MINATQSIGNNTIKALFHTYSYI